MNDTDTLIKKLDALLDKERKALIEGNLEALTELVEEKETLIAALNEIELEAPENLSEVSSKVNRNQALLEGALDGIRSAARRLAELRQARKTLDTYDKNGRKTRIDDNTAKKLEKRA